MWIVIVVDCLSVWDIVCWFRWLFFVGLFVVNIVSCSGVVLSLVRVNW